MSRFDDRTLGWTRYIVSNLDKYRDDILDLAVKDLTGVIVCGEYDFQRDEAYHLFKIIDKEITRRQINRAIEELLS